MFATFAKGSVFIGRDTQYSLTLKIKILLFQNRTHLSDSNSSIELETALSSFTSMSVKDTARIEDLCDEVCKEHS